MQKPSPQVLIVGAGPTGLTLACELRRRGVQVRLVEAAAAPTNHSKGKGLQPRTLEVFDDLGLVADALADGCAYPRFAAHWGPITIPAGRLDKPKAASAEVPYPNLWMLPQWRTEQLLRRKLEELGGAVELGVRLLDFEQDASGVNARLGMPAKHQAAAHTAPERENEQHEHVRVDYLIGCDGGHSAVRKALPVGFAGEALPGARAVIADVELSGLDREAWHVWPWARGCVLTLCPLPGTASFQLAAPLSAKSTPPELTLDGLRRFVSAATGGRVRVESVSWASLYRPQVRMVDRYRVDRVLLAGDAAHVHPPAGGQGLNTGVQDAYNLGWKLAAILAGAPDALLDSYGSERLPVAAAMLGLSKRLLLTHSRRRGAETQQLGLSYRDSVLSLAAESDNGKATRKLQAGDRAPDAHGCDAGGQPQRLFDLFRGPHFTILNFGSEQALNVSDTLWGADIRCVRVVPQTNTAKTGDWVDTRGRARTTYGVREQGSVLVRPDGYVAAISEGGAADLVARYRALLPSA